MDAKRIISHMRLMGYRSVKIDGGQLVPQNQDKDLFDEDILSIMDVSLPGLIEAAIEQGQHFEVHGDWCGFKKKSRPNPETETA